MTKTIRELEVVYEALELAKEYNLQAEVILWALRSKEVTIQAKLQDGLNEWIK